MAHQNMIYLLWLLHYLLDYSKQDLDICKYVIISKLYSTYSFADNFLSFKV